MCSPFGCLAQHGLLHVRPFCGVVADHACAARQGSTHSVAILRQSTASRPQALAVLCICTFCRPGRGCWHHRAGVQLSTASGSSGVQPCQIMVRHWRRAAACSCMHGSARNLRQARRYRCYCDDSRQFLRLHFEQGSAARDQKQATICNASATFCGSIGGLQADEYDHTAASALWPSPTRSGTAHLTPYSQ